MKLPGREGTGPHLVFPLLDRVVDVRLRPVLGDDLVEVQGQGRDEVGGETDLYWHFDGMSVDCLCSQSFVVGFQSRQWHHPGRCGVGVDHAVKAVYHVIGGNRLAVLPHCSFVKVEGVSAAVVVYLPPRSQVTPQVVGILGLRVVLNETVVDTRGVHDIDGVGNVRVPVWRREGVGLHIYLAAGLGHGDDRGRFRCLGHGGGGWETW